MGRLGAPRLAACALGTLIVNAVGVAGVTGLLSAMETLGAQARPPLIPSLCTHFTRAGIEWRRCFAWRGHTNYYKAPHHSGQAEP